MECILEALTPQQREVFDECCENEFVSATEFSEKYESKLTQVELLEVFARLKTHQTMANMQNMLWGEAERLGDIYYLRKAGNWVGSDWYWAFVKEEEKEYLEKCRIEDETEEESNF